jgi:hypothetical protein
MIKKPYTTMLNAGVGMIDETIIILNLWNHTISPSELYRVALNSGAFPNITARRLKNFIDECFRPRYLINDGYPATLLKAVQAKISNRAFNQLLFLFTCRESIVLNDFVHDVYWSSYAAGKVQIEKDDALAFLGNTASKEKTSKPWSENTVSRVASYLTSSCADFSLLEAGAKRTRTILNFKIDPITSIILAYDLHFSGLGDNNVLNHPDWGLFGMDREDVLNELKRQALKGWFIIQSAGEATRIGWQYETMEAVLDVITQK